MLPDNRNEPAAPEAPQRRFRKLRIAWSVVWGVVALMLIALWVRSYRWADTFTFSITSTHLLRVGSTQGGMTLIKSEGYLKYGWELLHDSVADPLVAKLFRPQNRPGYHGVLGLGFINSAPFFVICLPYWFLLALSAAIATIPWRSQMSPRFGLRALFIATTLVAVVLGLIVSLVK